MSVHLFGPGRRRAIGALTALATAPLPGIRTAHAQSRPVLRIGFQKSASLLTFQKSRGTLERRLAALGTSVRWVEFPAGPQLLEGLNVGSVDVGYVGEAPPIFAQAAGAEFVYIGHDPAAPRAEAIVVPQGSALRTAADLRGRKVALNKGSNVHYLLVRALERAGVPYAEVRPVFLPPADARAAFERGSVDAWAIWDPFLAAVELQSGARILEDGQGLVNNYAYYLGERAFVERHPEVIGALFDDSAEQARELQRDPRQAAAAIAPLQGLDPAVVERALQRYRFGVTPLTPQVVAEQQRIADAFLALRLIPLPIRIADALPAGALASTR